MASEWRAFHRTADEWLINYSILPVGSSLTAVQLFSVGHALELYLKAVNSKLTGNIDDAVKFGHKVVAIWNDCKNRDPKFLPAYELRASVLARNLLDSNDYMTLPQSDVFHFLEYQELYIVSKHLADLKYLGAPLKSVKGAYALTYVFPNPMWAFLFREIRSYLGIPEEGQWDLIQYQIEVGFLPPASLEFLNEVLGN